MPVCSFYLERRCNKESCPYRHVNVSRDAKICDDFTNGHCPKGDQVFFSKESFLIFNLVFYSVKMFICSFVKIIMEKGNVKGVIDAQCHMLDLLTID